MDIALFPYERLILEALEKEYALDRVLVVGFASSLNQLSRLFEMISQSDIELRTGPLVIIGFINHTHHLIIGGLQALMVGNGPVWSACVRGLAETLGACKIISDSPAKAVSFFDGKIKAGQLAAAAEKVSPGLKNDINRLSQIVHPGSRAIVAGWNKFDSVTLTAVFQYGLRHPTNEDGCEEGVTVLANLASLILEMLNQLSEQKDVLSTGKVIMVRTSINQKKGNG